MKFASNGIRAVFCTAGLLCMFLFIGCQTGKFSMPKMPNLAFWNKDKPNLSTRHEDYAEPPASRLTPTRSKLANDDSGAPPTTPPSRPLYSVDDEAGSGTRVASNSETDVSVDLGKAYSDVLDEAKSSMGNGSSNRGSNNSSINTLQPKQTDSVKSGGSFYSQQSTGNSNNSTNSFGGGRFNGKVTGTKHLNVDSEKPGSKKISNPFAKQAENANVQNSSVAPIGTSNLDMANSLQPVSENQSASYDYPSTPYNEFQPRQVTNQPEFNRPKMEKSEVPKIESPADTLKNQFNTTSPSFDSNSQMNQPPVNAAPKPNRKKIVNPYASASKTQPNQNQVSQSPLTQISLDQNKANLPAALRNVQGSFAPGSVKNAGSMTTSSGPEVKTALLPEDNLPAGPIYKAPVRNQNQGLPTGGSFQPK